MDSTLKYDLLGPFEKKAVQDFIDFLFSKKKDSHKPNPADDSKKNLLSVSVWSDEDLRIFHRRII